MIVKLGLATGLSLLLLSGCSGDNSNDKKEDIKPKSITQQLTDRDVVAIVKHYPKMECLSKVKPAVEEKGLTNVIVSVEDNNATCEDYGKKNDEIECAIKDAGFDLDTSCVVGADAPGTPTKESIENMEFNLIDETNSATIGLI